MLSIGERTTGDRGEDAEGAAARGGPWLSPPGCPRSFPLREDGEDFSIGSHHWGRSALGGMGLEGDEGERGGLTDSQKENLTTNTKPPTGSKQDGQVAVGQDPLGSQLTGSMAQRPGLPLAGTRPIMGRSTSILKIPVLAGLELT